MASQKKTISPSSSSSAPLPRWFRNEYIPSFSSGIAHCFLLNGDIYGATAQGISHIRFLQTILAQRRKVVAYYNRATGITFPLPSMKEEALKLLGNPTLSPSPQTPMAAAIAASGIGAPSVVTNVIDAARTPLAAIQLLGQLLRSPQGRNQVAVIIDYADFLFPAMEKSAMSADDRLLLITLLIWGQDHELGAYNNPLFLCARDLSEIHADLRASNSGYKQIDIELPDQEERLAYLQWYLREQKSIPLRDTLTLSEVAHLCSGLSIQQIEDILLLANKENGITRRLVTARKAAIIRSVYTMVDLMEPLAGGFAAIGGNKRLIDWFTNEVVLPIRAGQRDVPKGLLLVGPPGTGKTLLVSALAEAIGFSAVALRAENILGARVGESERLFRQFRSFCESLAPVLVFIDEIDQSDLARRGTASGNPVAANLFNSMLQWLSDESIRGKVIIMMATNRPDLMDTALTRPGRMDAIIPMLLPNDEGRKDILRVQSERRKVPLTEEALEAFVAASVNYSAADLATLLTKAQKIARREKRTTITLPDAQLALRLLRPQTPNIAQQYIELALKSCTDFELIPPEYASMFLAETSSQSTNEDLPSMRTEREW